VRGRAAAEFEKNCREMYDQIARIAIVSGWVRFYDFGAGSGPRHRLRGLRRLPGQAARTSGASSVPPHPGTGIYREDFSYHEGFSSNTTYKSSVNEKSSKQWTHGASLRIPGPACRGMTRTAGRHDCERHGATVPPGTHAGSRVLVMPAGMP